MINMIMTNNMKTKLSVKDKWNIAKDKWDTVMEGFATRHPYVSFLALFIGMPLCILLAVCLCTTVTMLPVAWIMGWV